MGQRRVLSVLALSFGLVLLRRRDRFVVRRARSRFVRRHVGHPMIVAAQGACSMPRDLISAARGTVMAFVMQRDPGPWPRGAAMRDDGRSSITSAGFEQAV